MHHSIFILVIIIIFYHDPCQLSIIHTSILLHFNKRQTAFMATTKEIKPVKLCYEHIGGKLGMLLMECFIEKGWIMKTDEEKLFYITDKGQKEFTKLGIDLSQIKS